LYAQNEVNTKYLKNEVNLSFIQKFEIFKSNYSYTSIKIEPNGKRPPNKVIISGSVYHFFSGIGLGTALMRHG
jgi:hypothetical protein